jgi:hypothetical protein
MRLVTHELLLLRLQYTKESFTAFPIRSSSKATHWPIRRCCLFICFVDTPLGESHKLFGLLVVCLDKFDGVIAVPQLYEVRYSIFGSIGRKRSREEQWAQRVVGISGNLDLNRAGQIVVRYFAYDNGHFLKSSDM